MAPTVVEKACVICGQKSYRADWQSAQYPVCDSHSKAEVQQAITRLSPQLVPPAKPVTPPAPPAAPSSPAPNGPTS